jgi:Rrf2 family protein
VISQKCQYGLRALFELARRRGSGPVKIAEIAASQAIPSRFLEAILGQLRQGGFVSSRRGAAGGYELVRDPAELTLGEVIRFFEGPMVPVSCVGARGRETCPLRGDCVFMPVWERAEKAVSEVYDETSLQDLVDEQRRRCPPSAADYAI